MKRVLCLLLAMLFLTGCTVPITPDPSGSAADADKIIVTLPTIEGSNMTGLPEVQAAINAITIPEIGVEVEFRCFNAVNTPTEYPNALTQGQPIDLMVLNNENIESYVNQKLLLPLDGLLSKYGTDILQISREYTSLTDGTVFAEQTYGIAPVGDSVGQCGALWINPQLLEEVSFPYDPEKIYTFEELDTLFAALKKAYPDAYPLGQITNNYGFSTSSFFLGIYANHLSGSDPGAVDALIDDDRIVNCYEAERYYQWLQYMRKWYQDGYIYPDSAITTATSIGLLQAGLVLSVPQVGTPYMLTKEAVGTSIVPLRLSQIQKGENSSTGIFWTIPATSKEPEAAMKFLNMMFWDERIVNLLSWGILGRDYSLADGNIPSYLESCTFYNPLGMYGDQRLRYDMYGQAKKDALAAFSEKAVPINPQYNGFRFDDSELLQELLEIQRIESQYVKLLEAGCVDLETVYPEFIQKLYDAGLQQVLDEKQRQLDAWLAENQEE